MRIVPRVLIDFAGTRLPMWGVYVVLAGTRSSRSEVVPHANLYNVSVNDRMLYLLYNTYLMR